jgi:peroxiredoxin family protein
MFEAEMKSSIIKIATLEQELKSELNERKKAEIEFNSYKDKQSAEFRELQDQKKQLEVSLKNCKMNNELMNSEMEHLRTEMINLEKIKVGDKDKELSRLREQVKEVVVWVY